ncbi:MAG: 8-amino-7-oxononanoate synthase [Verrucomicrobia bacterium]|nr:8-amino-7-oxononanoate synthase [Verrucomicrobiota bacterium]
MNREAWIDDELRKLRVDNLERHIRVFPHAGGKINIDGHEVLNFSSNDYLNLAGRPELARAAKRAIDDFGAGSAASRLVTGTLPIHDELEMQLARHKGYPAAILFGSGYLANSSTVPALVGRNDTIFADRFIHASMIDAAKLSDARLVRFRHNDCGHLEELLTMHADKGRRLILIESVYSMDGSIPPLREIAATAEKNNALLLVDEAHATGVLGPRGGGLIRQEHLEESVNVAMGTLSKGLGGYGGFVACSESIRKLLVNRGRGLIYSTAPPPSVAGSALAALEVLDKEPDLGTILMERASRFRKRLNDAGLDTLDSQTQIIPIIAGSNESALGLAERLLEDRIIAIAIRPPTVPKGTARVRLSVTLAHEDRDLEQASEVIIRAARNEGIL